MNLELPQYIKMNVGGTYTKIKTKDFVEIITGAFKRNKNKNTTEADVKRQLCLIMNDMKTDEVGDYLRTKIKFIEDDLT